MRPTLPELSLVLAGALALAAPAAAQMLPIRDQNPLLRGAYLPLPAATAVPSGDGWALAAGLDWSNTTNIQQNASEQLVVDEETVEVGLTALRTQGAWQVRATLPVLNRSAGVLDDFINGWHAFFGLPKGDRPSRPRNAYLIEYQRTGSPALVVPAGTALGDLALEAGRTLAASPDGALTAWLGIEAPTGSRARLTTDGALDAAAWLDGALALSTRWSLAGRAGLTHAGGDAGLPLARTAGFGTLALGWHATHALEMLLQFDAHTRLARDSDLKFLGSAVELTIGGRYRLASGAVFEAGVVEDIEVDHSPDVTFHFGWRWPVFGRGR